MGKETSDVGRWRALVITASLFCLIVGSCYRTDIPPPKIKRVEPARCEGHEPLTVTIRGSAFIPKTIRALDKRNKFDVDEGFAAVLFRSGSNGKRVETALKKVTYLNNETLTAEVPARIPQGSYALEVTTPYDLAVVRKKAFTVADGDSDTDADNDSGGGSDSDGDSDSGTDSDSEGDTTTDSNGDDDIYDIICGSDNSCDESCSTPTCALLCHEQAQCLFDCGTNTCDITSRDMSTCNVNTCSSSECNLSCEERSSCMMICSGDNCTATSTSAAPMIVDCSARSCKAECRGTGECMLTCTSAACTMPGSTNCDNNIHVLNRDCP